MPDNRNHYVGARFTEKEKETIQNAANIRNQTISELIRDAIFTHLNFINKNQGNIEKIEMLVLKTNPEKLSPKV